MENIALIESFSEFKDDKLIDRVTLMAILEDVFRNALKKKFGDDDNFDIIINPDKGDLEIWRNRVVVADGEVEDENQEIRVQVIDEYKTTEEDEDDIVEANEVETEIEGEIFSGNSLKDRRQYAVCAMLYVVNCIWYIVIM